MSEATTAPRQLGHMPHPDTNLHIKSIQWQTVRNMHETKPRPAA